jgi:predicted phage terminase large subunit-like protein
VPKDDRRARRSPLGITRRLKVTGYELTDFADPRQHEGELLAPGIMNRETVTAMKHAPDFGPWRFQAQFNQNPTPREGALFPAEHWQYWTRPPVNAAGQVVFDDWLQSWDCAFKELADTDYVVGQVWARLGVNFYLIDQVRARMSFSKTCEAMERLSARWPMAIRKLVEDKANGPAVIDALTKRLPGLVAVDPRGGKIARANAVQGYHEGHNLYLPATPAPDQRGAEWPDPHPRNKGQWLRHESFWVPDFVGECERFPKAINDDQVDAFTQAINYWIPKVATFVPKIPSLKKASYWR